MDAPHLPVTRYKNRFSLSSKVKRGLWSVCWLFLFRPTPRWGGDPWRVALLRAFGAKIGAHCRISPSCKVWAPWNLTMKGYTSVGDGVDCYCVAPITLGVKVAVSQRTFLCAASHDYTTLERPLTQAPIVVEDHAWICAECFVHPGVTIGEGAVIGARSVVVKDLPAWMVSTGHPCKPLKPREVRERPS